MHVIVN